MQYIVKNAFSLSNWHITSFKSKSHSTPNNTIVSFYLGVACRVIYGTVALSDSSFDQIRFKFCRDKRTGIIRMDTPRNTTKGKQAM